MSTPLVLYFSVEGHTAQAARHIASQIGADLAEIVPEIEYTSNDINWQDAGSRSSLENQEESARPGYKPLDVNLDDYDTVFIGYPIWWYTAPRIIESVLEAEDFSGKTIIPFATSGGSAIEKSEQVFVDHLKDKARIKPGLAMNGSTRKHAFYDWLSSLELNENS